MTDPQTPATEAGRADLVWRQCVCEAWYWGSAQTGTDKAHSRIYDIEAEARADALREVGELVELHDEAVLAIRVAALREAADAVRALDRTYDTGSGQSVRTAVLAILDPQPNPKAWVQTKTDLQR